MRFSLVTLHVKDPEKSLRFYHELMGMPILRKAPMPLGDIVFLGGENGVNLELIPAEPGYGVRGSGFSIGFDVESMEQAVRGMEENGYYPKREPFCPNPHTTLAFFEGPDGEEVELIEERNL